MSRQAMCPGSFDPITYGHVDIIERTARIFDGVIVGVFNNPQKDHLFSCRERIYLAEKSLQEFDNVVIEEGSGLLVDYAKKRGISTVIKGLRAVSDFEYEFQMAQMNRTIGNRVETLFMMTRPEHSYLSSSIVKELSLYGADISAMVPPVVRRALKEKRNGEETAADK